MFVICLDFLRSYASEGHKPICSTSSLWRCQFLQRGCFRNIEVSPRDVSLSHSLQCTFTDSLLLTCRKPLSTCRLLALYAWFHNIYMFSWFWTDDVRVSSSGKDIVAPLGYMNWPERMNEFLGTGVASCVFFNFAGFACPQTKCDWAHFQNLTNQYESPINQVRVYHSTHYLLQPFHCIISCKQCIYVLTCLVSRTQRSFHSSVAKHLTTY